MPASPALEATVIEVTAKIGDSTIDVVHVPPGGAYFVPIGAFARFPLVDDELVRVPAGAAARVAGHTVGEQRLRIGHDPIELEIGIVHYEIQRIRREPLPVARPRVDRKLPLYFAASAILLVSIWLVAVVTHPYRAPPAKKHPQFVHIDHAETKKPEPAKPPKPEPAKEATKAAASSGHPRRQSRGEVASRAGHDDQELTVFSAMARVAALPSPTIELDGSGAGPDDYIVASDYGNGRNFNVDDNPDYASTKVGNYDIPTAGKMLGQTLPPPRIEFCDADSCLAHGPIAVGTFVNELARHEKAISDCYVDHTDHVAGTVRLRFAVSPDGKAHGVSPKLGGASYREDVSGPPVGTGIGTVGRCVASIVGKTRWPKASAETTVWIGIAFSPKAG